MAVRALGLLVPGYDPLPELQRELDDCLKVNGPGVPLTTAESRGQTRASYACGAMLALIAEGAMRKRDPGADVFTFIRMLIDRNRAGGKVDGAKWVAAFIASGGDPKSAQRIQGFVERGDPDPAAMFEALFTANGVRFARNGEALKLR